MSKRGLDRAMRQLAEQQHSVVSRSQARRLGADRWALDRRLHAGEWDSPTSQVLRVVGSAPTFQQRCMVAVLHHGEGTVASGVTAARLWGLPGFSSPELEVTRHRHRATCRDRELETVLHCPRLLPPHHRTVLDGIPLTTVARTVFDLAGCLHPHRTERALDNALSRKLLELETARAVTLELLRRGRAGSALMRRLLRERGAAYIPPESGLEARFLAVVARAGIEAPECQVELGGESWVGRVDHLFRRWNLVAEIDSALHHSSKLDRESDARRDAALQSAGYEVLRFTDEQVWERPSQIVAQLRAAIGAARRDTSGSGSVAISATLSLPEV